MARNEHHELFIVGKVRSELGDRSEAPKQADEGAPPAWLEIAPTYAEAVAGLGPGDEIVVLTWLHLADREVMTVHPRNDPSRPLTGVFGTRSPDRPNPIGLHRARVTAVDGSRIQVNQLEAIDGTPIVDIKYVLGDIDER